MAEIEIKFVVFNYKDAKKYLNAEDFETLARLQGTINAGRIKDGKKTNSYWVCNTDEPYAQTIINTILKGENEKLKPKHPAICPICKRQCNLIFEDGLKFYDEMPELINDLKKYGKDKYHCECGVVLSLEELLNP